MDKLITSLLQQIRTSVNHSENQLIETHISWIILSGQYAYKIKKPVNLGFLDFSTLEKRYFFCQEELRLNRRLAPTFYLDVIPITGSIEQPQLDGDGDIIEYAVKMKRFPPNAELFHVIEKNALEYKHIDQMAALIAQFHSSIKPENSPAHLGTAVTAHRSTLDTFATLFANLHDSDEIQKVKTIQEWMQQTFDKNQAIFQERHAKAFVRECHGDLHLGNIALVEDNIILFDGIEFSETFRWIDVISEIAFLIMDLQYQGLHAYALRFLNTYLEYTGDYEGLRLLPYYLVYRTIVRAMVARLRASQDDVETDERHKLLENCNKYIQLTQYFKPIEKTILFICHGLSASGKSTISQIILEHLPAIRLRSDVERKRLFGMSRFEKSDSKPGENIYNINASEKTYSRLKQLAAHVLGSGYHVIVDATFLSHTQRSAFHSMAKAEQSAFVILDFTTPELKLRDRIIQRSKNHAEVSDADIQVLEYQIKTREPLSDTEKKYCCGIDTDNTFNYSEFHQQLQFLLESS